MHDATSFRGEPRIRTELCGHRVGREHLLLQWISAALIGAIVGCTSRGADIQAPSTFDAIVFGRVTGPGGEPIGGARVVLEHRPEGCTGSRNERENTATNAQGYYRTLFHLGTARKSTSCFVAWAEPPAQSAFQASDTVTFDVRFGDPEYVLPDSVQVNLSVDRK